MSFETNGLIPLSQTDPNYLEVIMKGKFSPLLPHQGHVAKIWCHLRSHALTHFHSSTYSYTHSHTLTIIHAHTHTRTHAQSLCSSKHPCGFKSLEPNVRIDRSISHTKADGCRLTPSTSRTCTLSHALACTTTHTRTRTLKRKSPALSNFQKSTTARF